MVVFRNINIVAFVAALDDFGRHQDLVIVLIFHQNDISQQVGFQHIVAIGEVDFYWESAVGANYIEGNEGLSKKDSLKYFRISRKEAKESGYWLRLIETFNDSSLQNERDKLVGESQNWWESCRQSFTRLPAKEQIR